jgi:SAM-dependent methyltransferase
MKVTKIDIGCGTKEQKYPGCVGLDINYDYKPDMHYDCEQGLPFKTNSLVFINSDNSLEHFRNAYFVLNECYRCLKPEGTMRLVVPNCQYLPLILINIFTDLNRFWYWYMNLHFKCDRTVHWHLFTKHLISMIARDIGFTITKKKGWLYSKEITLMLEKDEGK